MKDRQTSSLHWFNSVYMSWSMGLTLARCCLQHQPQNRKKETLIVDFTGPGSVRSLSKRPLPHVLWNNYLRATNYFKTTRKRQPGRPLLQTVSYSCLRYDNSHRTVNRLRGPYELVHLPNRIPQTATYLFPTRIRKSHLSAQKQYQNS